ncbi:hypothetical protein DDZ18_04255 [Marinicauda salina]|uniref:histidine kinase n=1 Tax=Marinicauda salina TaxID=2135793 RepID=A0A2U2BXS3_9PROT|nr:sensor histidine kinase [Marinicauda salina]PWE18811.1 hypothetical protein DDZ18_04255 [Marinicauda salina]
MTTSTGPRPSDRPPEAPLLEGEAEGEHHAFFPHPRERRFGLRLRLLIVVGVALLPVLALSVFKIYLDYRTDLEARREALGLRAQIAAREEREALETVGAELRTLARHPQVRGGVAGCEGALDRALDVDPVYADLARLDGDGTVLCSAGPAGDSGWAARLQPGDGVAFGGFEPDPAGSGMLLRAAVAAPGAAGGFDGALAAGVRTTLPETSPGAPDDAEIGLVDARGRIAGAPVAAPLQPIAPEILAEAREDGLAWFIRDAPDGRAVMHALTPLFGGALYALAARPAPDLIAFAGLDLAGTVLLPLSMYLLALTAVWVATDALVLRWLAYLRRLASAYGRGRYSVRPLQARVAPGEMRELSETFDWMARSIAKRDAELQASLDQKQTLIKEIHHRVKNNLQIITSLLNLQMNAMEDPAGRRALADAQTRINALALVHRSLYEAGDVGRVRLKPFLDELCRLTHAATGGDESHVALETDIADIALDAERAAPLALFVTEAMTNAYKHAFTDRASGRLSVRVRLCDPWEEDVEAGPGGLACASVVDDGVGAVETKKSGKRRGVGGSLFDAFARQLGGEARSGPAPGGGHVAEVRFPLAVDEGKNDSDAPGVDGEQGPAPRPQQG